MNKLKKLQLSALQQVKKQVNCEIKYIESQILFIRESKKFKLNYLKQIKLRIKELYS